MSDTTLSKTFDVINLRQVNIKLITRACDTSYYYVEVPALTQCNI